MSYIGVEGWFYLSMDMRIKNSIYGVECSKRQELCKICLDCRYDILSLGSVQKGHERWETLCDDYQHPRFCTIYRALKTWISSWSGSHECPITTTNLGGWYGVSTPSVRSVSRPTSYISSPVCGPGRKVGSMIGSIGTLPNALAISAAWSS